MYFSFSTKPKVNLFINMDYKKALKLADEVTGSLVELGFGKGNSLKEFISYMNKSQISKRNIWIYESFEGYSTPAPEDKGAFKKGEFKRPPQPAYDIKNTVKSEVHLVKGYIEDTLPTQYDNSPVSILHSHLISYSSTQYGLDTFHKFIPIGGIIIVSDYEIFEGTKLAVDQFKAKNSPHYEVVSTNSSFIALKKVEVKNLKAKVSRTRSVLT